MNPHDLEKWISRFENCILQSSMIAERPKFYLFDKEVHDIRELLEELQKARELIKSLQFCFKDRCDELHSLQNKFWDIERGLQQWRNGEKRYVEPKSEVRTMLLKNISLCKSCNCMTKDIMNDRTAYTDDGKYEYTMIVCGKCGATK